MFEAIKSNVVNFRNCEPSHFVNGNVVFDEMPDSHSVAIVCSHHGMPLYKVKPGKYEVHDTNPQVNSEPLKQYRKAIERLLLTL